MKTNIKRILIINPGATSTKIAIYENKNLIFKTNIEHSSVMLEKYNTVFDQYQYRMRLIKETLKTKNIILQSLHGIVARGGLLKPISSGVYIVNQKMVDELKRAERGEHASNLGAILAFNIAKELSITAYIVDPVTVDEMEDVARVTGLPDIERISRFHALNHKSIARKVAKKDGNNYEEMNYIVAHMGTGVSVAAHKRGRVVDVHDPKNEGAFSPDRCGSIPAHLLVQLCYSGKYTYQQMLEKLSTKGGIYAYLGTRDLREVEDMADGGNKKAELIIEALAYQIAKDIGAQATVLAGKVDRIILTGGMAYSKIIVKKIKDSVCYIAPIEEVPGEEEMESLAIGGLAVLRGEFKAKIYE